LKPSSTCGWTRPSEKPVSRAARRAPWKGLYVPGAPLSKAEARLDDDSEQGEALFVDGKVRDIGGRPIAGAVVDVWHANPLGGYSFFDPSQPKYNLRRRIETDAEGRYQFRSILPAGYACSPEGPTQRLLDQLGRHGRRPAHIHFFVTARAIGS
jgi:catechol 1,2-dioxygenase